MTKPAHVAYLLRLWPADVAGHGYLRASLEDARTRKVQGFENLESLLAYLRHLERSSLGASDAAVGERDRR